MEQTKSPFIVIPGFFSPMVCERIRAGDIEMDELRDIAKDKIIALTPTINAHYNCSIASLSGMHHIHLQVGDTYGPCCDNSEYKESVWIRSQLRDFSAYVSLCDYNDTPPFDTESEVLGAKYEFPQHGFGFNPQIGTLIIHPSEQHFINHMSPIRVGIHQCVKFYLTCDTMFIYDYQQFPGSYVDWFVGV